MAVTPLAKYKLVFLVRRRACCEGQSLCCAAKLVDVLCPASTALRGLGPLLLAQGDQSVGKTSIITRFMYDKFDTTYQVGATLVA